MATNTHLQYGKALYQLASRQKVEEAIWHDLNGMTALFHNKSWQKAMNGLNALTPAAKEKIIEETFGGKVHVFVVNLLKILAVRKVLKLVPKIAQVYSQFYHEARGIDALVVRSARVMSKDEEHALVKKIETLKAKKVSVHFEHSPALIAGIQIFEKGYLTDYSVQNYLESLKHHLLRNSASF